MITKELTKTIAPPTSISERIVNLLPYRRQEVHTVETKVQPLFSTWPKLAYAHWIEQVKEKFKKGDFVCDRKIPSVLGRSPLPYYIVDIEEIHLHATMDMDRKIPKAIAVAIVGTSTPTWRVPDDLRHLTEDEISSGNLRANKEDFPEPEAQIITNPNAY